MLDDLAFDMSDEELTAEALAADPHVPLSDDAVPFQTLHDEGAPLLPEWYMPVAAGGVRTDWRARVAIGIAVGLVFINALGICVTYGFPQIF